MQIFVERMSPMKNRGNLYKRHIVKIH